MVITTLNILQFHEKSNNMQENVFVSVKAEYIHFDQTAK